MSEQPPLQAATEAVAAVYSRFVQRVRRRHGADMTLLAPGLPDAAGIDTTIEHLLQQGHSLAASLRITRQLVLERLAVLDIEASAPVEDITAAMTALAETTLERALEQSQSELDAQYGVPRDADGRRIEFWIVGMGKLGARELNVSSDIDLVYVYEDAGQTDGGTSITITAHEYFSRLVRRLYALIGDTTDEGFVFRMDLALRPNGNSGPPVVSLAMLEEYFIVQGREWERFAWLKSRVVAPRASIAGSGPLALRATVVPFVYRRYLDYGVFEGLRQLHRKVRDEAQRRAAGRPERAYDVKLSRGGIREIEFIVQLLQVVRGGQFPEIRTRSTIKALLRLTARSIIKPATAEALSDAYIFLRRLEHRIQYLDDQQTHVLPLRDDDLGWIARSLGLADACQLLHKLDATRELVATEFDALLHDGQPPSRNGSGSCRNGTCGPVPVPVDSEEFIARMPAEMAQRLREWSTQPRVQTLREEAKLRLAKLITRVSDAIEQEDCTLEAALRFMDWLEPLLKRDSYLALLIEKPEAQTRLLRLIGMARWPKRYLMLHPGVIDELADEHLVHSRFEPAAFTADLEARHRAWERSGQADEEALLDTLRRAHHAEVFRTLVRDVENHITVEQVADDLSALADAVLDRALHWAWQRFKQRHRDDPRVAIIAYGKLGGKELGYGSDLDLVFLYDDDDERAPEVYGAFVRKVISWLAVRTAAGELFDIDTELRPNGSSGLLVTSMTAFEQYQKGRGSNTAWTWEHQAITRARFCAGCTGLAERFEATRRNVLCAPREPEMLAAEIRQMREKVRAARPVKDGLFDVKHSPGGMMDAEFAVQYLVLARGADHLPLLDNAGNIALLQRAEAAGLLPPGVGADAAGAYRELRRAQHRARLDERPTQFPPDQLAREREAVLTLWRSVFG